MNESTKEQKHIAMEMYDKNPFVKKLIRDDHKANCIRLIAINCIVWTIVLYFGYELYCDITEILNK